MNCSLRSHRVVTPNGVESATIWVKNGIIERHSNHAEAPPDVLDYGYAVIAPGLIDAHVHINEPGRTDWEGFETATRAAAAGGVTTLVEMPLNASPVVTTLDAWQQKIAATAGKLRVDCGFYGGLVPGNLDQLEPMLDAGALGIKAFLVHSGLDEFPAAREKELCDAMPLLARRGALLLVHAELESENGQTPRAPSSRRYADYLASRPPDWETRAIAWIIELCRETGCRVHIVHLATAEALPMLRAARSEGLPITVETAPHYLFFEAETIPDGATQYKCAPPIREAHNREGLWEGLRDGTIDFIASDHSPCPPHLKNLDTGDFAGAWGGIASLQWTLPTVWSEAKQRGLGLEDVTRWTSQKPAQILGLNQKGAIEKGRDADFVVWQPETTLTISPQTNFHHHKVTPYEGRELFGAVEATFLRGNRIYDGSHFSNEISGEVVLKMSNLALDKLNSWNEREAFDALLRCCGASKWAAKVMAARPFSSETELFEASEQAFSGLEATDWLEAFSHHPKIGDIDSLRTKFATTRAWAGNEQSGTSVASEETLQALAQGNQLYEDKFGFIFIICATGRSADEMLVALQARLGNEAGVELQNAATQQKLITQLRLEKLLTT